jgi:hypothetical protein
MEVHLIVVLKVEKPFDSVPATFRASCLVPRANGNLPLSDPIRDAQEPTGCDRFESRMAPWDKL